MFMRATSRLKDLFEEEIQKKDCYKLIIKRTVRTHNSWTHNTRRMIKGTGQTNFAFINPTDAETLKLEDGDLADVSTKYGKIRIPVRLSKALTPGAIAIPHGWGHQHAEGLKVAY